MSFSVWIAALSRHPWSRCNPPPFGVIQEEGTRITSNDRKVFVCLLSGADNESKSFFILQEIQRDHVRGWVLLRKWNSNFNNLVEAIKKFEGKVQEGTIKEKFEPQVTEGIVKEEGESFAKATRQRGQWGQNLLTK